MTRKLLKEKGVELALFANPFSIKWLTGFAPPVQVGPDPFAGGPPLIWYEGGSFTLFAVDHLAEAAASFARQQNCRVVGYPGNTVDQPLAGAQRLAAALRQTVSAVGVQAEKVGYEATDVTALVFETMHAGMPGASDFLPIDGWLEPLRMVKTREELAKLRENFGLADLGQAVAREAVMAGEREIDVWTAVQRAVERAAGCRVPMGNDCLVSHRQANVVGWPRDYTIWSHSSLIVDLSTVLHGYWSDSCGTYYAGDPTPQQVALHRTVLEALEYGISLVRPGAIAKEIDRQMRGFIDDAGYPVYPHHTGHGVGVANHEAPRIVPYNEQVLQEGMVIMLEPGIYIPGEMGVRLEDALLVTPDGAEVLTRHNKGLP
jgi:Xaa-Pro dipeptidase